MLAEALKRNPDIRVAAAKVAEADAELNRIRLLVTQKVVMLYYAIETQKKTVAHQEARYNRLEAMFKSNTISAEDVAEARQALALAKGKLEELEAQLPALLGKVQKSAISEKDGVQWNYDVDDRPDVLLRPESSSSQTFRWLRSNTYKFEHAKVNLPHAEKLRKALQTPIKVTFKDVTFDEILKGLSGMVEGLSFRNLFERSGSGHFELPKRSLQFDEAIPVSAVLQALEDEMGCLFFVREYGIVATTKNGAPHGAMTVEEFLHHKPTDEARPKVGDGNNPLAGNLEGVVKSVDAGGLFTISIGSDAGLAKGQTLELYWMPHRPPINDARSLGTVRIVEVEAHQAVAQPVGRLAHTPQPGDRITGRIQKK